MNAMQKKMIAKIGDMATTCADEFNSHRDRLHSKREDLRRAELDRVKAQQRLDEVTNGAKGIPADRRGRYRDEAAEELRDTENRVVELKATIDRLSARMSELAKSRDSARKLSEALQKVAKATHPDFARIDAGSLTSGDLGPVRNVHKGITAPL